MSNAYPYALASAPVFKIFLLHGTWPKLYNHSTILRTEIPAYKKSTSCGPA